MGRHLVRMAVSRGLRVRGLSRTEAGARAIAEAGAQAVVVSGLHEPALSEALSGASAIVHLAHTGREEPGATFEDVNVEGTRAVASAARAAGAERLVLFSGLGVARYGMASHTTNRYFRSKLGAEHVAFRSGLEVVVLRPSYIVGPGDELVASLRAQMEAGVVEQIGDGAYRMQPVALEDAAEAALAAAWGKDMFPGACRHRVLDLVGPEPVSFADLRQRLFALVRARGGGAAHVVRPVPLEEAFGRARAGGFHGMGPESLDCLLCDEVADAAPLVELLGRALRPLDEALLGALV